MLHLMIFYPVSSLKKHRSTNLMMKPFHGSFRKLVCLSAFIKQCSLHQLAGGAVKTPKGCCLQHHVSMSLKRDTTSLMISCCLPTKLCNRLQAHWQLWWGLRWNSDNSYQCTFVTGPFPRSVQPNLILLLCSSKIITGHASSAARSQNFSWAYPVVNLTSQNFSWTSILTLQLIWQGTLPCSISS